MPSTSLSPSTITLSANLFSSHLTRLLLPLTSADTAIRTRKTCPPYLGLPKRSHRAAAHWLLAPPLPPSRRRHLRAPGPGHCAEPARAAGGGCCGAHAPPPLPRFALGSEGAPGRPAPAGHVVPPPFPGRRPLSRTSLTCQPRGGTPVPRVSPTLPRALPSQVRAPLPLFWDRPKGGRRGLGTSPAGRCATPLFLAPRIGFEGGARRIEEPIKAVISLRTKMEKGKVSPSRPLHALSVLGQHTAPHNYRPRETLGGSPSAHTPAKQCCRTDTAYGFWDLQGCDSLWRICIRWARHWQCNAAGKE